MDDIWAGLQEPFALYHMEARGTVAQAIILRVGNWAAGAPPPAQLEGRTVAEAYPAILRQAGFCDLLRAAVAAPRTRQTLAGYHWVDDHCDDLFDLVAVAWPAAAEIAGRTAPHGPRSVPTVLRPITSFHVLATAASRGAAAAVTAAASRAHESRQMFAANVSHEIRTPLTGIVGIIEMMGLTPLNPQQRDYMRLAANASVQLLAIINDILDFNRLEAREVALECAVMDLRETVENCADMVGMDFPQAELDIVVQVAAGTPTVVCGDRAKISQVVINLAKNAAKFSADRGRVALNVRADPPTVVDGVRRARFTVDVVDQGLGIAASDLPRLFVPYSQLNAGARVQHGGTGLGLVISRGFCRMMGGDITVVSAPGRGSTFSAAMVLELPEGAAAAAVGRPPGAAPVDFGALARGRRVLVVDDNEGNRITLRQICHAWQAVALVCASAQEALAALEMDGNVDAGILDFRMPGMDGLELATEIQRRGHGFPMVLLSSALGPVRGPFLAVLNKPISRPRLEQVLATAWATAAPAAPAAPAPPRPARVLVVEDYEPNRVALAAMLHSIGYTNVDTACDGAEAVAAAAAADYRVILMDIVMPVKDGVAAANEIRAAAPRPGSPAAGRRPPPVLVALTANAMAGDELKYRRPEHGGFDDYLAKPVTVASMTQLMRRVDGPARRTSAC